MSHNGVECNESKERWNESESEHVGIEKIRRMLLEYVGMCCHGPLLSPVQGSRMESWLVG